MIANTHKTAYRPGKALKRMLQVAAVLCATLGAWQAQAQALPQTTRIYVGSPPGGTNDVLARLVADRLGKQLNTTIVIENLSGAGGVIAQNKVASSPADGSTILLASTNDVLADAVAGTQKVQQGLTAVGGIAAVPFVLVGRPTLQAANLDELARLARQPGSKLTIGGAGAGTYAHLAAELVQREIDVRMVYAPYKGAAPALTDLMGGHIDLAMVGLTSVLPHLKAGSVRVYGLFSTKRSALAPEVPTLLESTALKSMKPFADAWIGLLMPVKTAPDIQRAFAAALTKVVATDEVRQQIRQVGADPAPMALEEMQRIIASDTVAFTALVKAANIKPE